MSRGTGEGDGEGVSWIARTFPGSTCIGCERCQTTGFLAPEGPNDGK